MQLDLTNKQQSRHCNMTLCRRSAAFRLQRRPFIVYSSHTYIRVNRLSLLVSRLEVQCIRHSLRYLTTSSSTGFSRCRRNTSRPQCFRTTASLTRKAALDRGRTDRISLTHDLDLHLWPWPSVPCELCKSSKWTVGGSCWVGVMWRSVAHRHRLHSSNGGHTPQYFWNYWGVAPVLFWLTVLLINTNICLMFKMQA